LEGVNILLQFREKVGGVNFLGKILKQAMSFIFNENKNFVFYN
jgi:hypothetical protein